MTAAAINHPTTKARRPAFAPSVRAFLTLLLLIIGVQSWIAAVGNRAESGDNAPWGETRQIWTLIVAAALGIVAMVTPGLRERSLAALNWLAHPTPLRRRIIASALMLLSALYLYQTAKSQQPQIGPVIHDEYCYQLQSKMLAGGHLWLPKHPLSDFFDSFHLLTDRVYAVKYGPGTALMYAPAIKLGLPAWFTPLLLSAISVGLLYLILTSFINGLAGLLGAILLLAVPVFRRVALQTLSQAPMLFLLLLALWAFLQWRTSRQIRWIVIMGLAVGWSAITRPVDAVAMATPLALAALWELRSVARRDALKTIAIALAAMAPFLLLQLIFNKGLTGSFTTLPWAYYSAHNDPYDTIAPKRDKIDRFDEWPEQAQKDKFLKDFSAVQYRLFTQKGPAKRLIAERLRPAIEDSLPNPMLLLLIPLGAVGLMSRRRWVAGAFLLIFFGVYTFYPFFLDHYAVVALPAIFLILLAGWDGLTKSIAPMANLVRLPGALAIVALAITALPQMRQHPEPDNWPTTATMRDYDAKLAALPAKPAIVLFHFDRQKSNEHCEPVYNIDAAWPDDAPIIRAHDLGPRNRELFAYYAARAPSRAVYTCDRGADDGSATMKYLGTVKELAAK